ncbi:MAG: uncharacterized protein QOG62_2184 [Thermoleophilaceae bacterium]|jgi:uncharacterized protein (TIGR01777 family)|nr:uncharacterized protein [Thermoleophilaceae bacterium]
MRIVVTGATGTIGPALVKELEARGDEVVALVRDPAKGRRLLGVESVAWTHPKLEVAPREAIEGADAVVNLLGEPVAQRWTEEAKHEIHSSRVLGTRNLVEGIALADRRPKVLVSGSATGWYGARGDEKVDETTPAARDYLAQVTVDWEHEARRAEDLGLRVVLTRTGVVLSPDGGALAKMLPPFKLGVGGPVAGGKQYMPWIHVDDVVGAILFSIDNDEASGPINLSAPTPVTNAEFSKALGRVLKRPAFAPVPAFAIKALYGEMSEIVTTGARAVPRRLEELGYTFRQPELEAALRAALNRT